MRSSSVGIVRLAVALAVIASLTACSSAPPAPEAELEVKNEAARLTEFGNGHFSRGEFGLALRFFELALAQNQSVDNLVGVVRSHNSIGRVYSATGQLANARAAYQQALDFAGLAEDVEGRIQTYINLGELELRTGDDDAALEWFREARALATADETLEDPVLFHNLGALYARTGDFAQARINLEQARAINEANRAWAELGSNLFMLASVASREGNFDEAYTFATAALDSDKRAENSPGIAADLWALGQISERRDDPDGAYQYYLRSLRVALTIDDVARALETLTALARIAPTLGRDAEAEAFDEQAARIREAIQ